MLESIVQNKNQLISRVLAFFFVLIIITDFHYKYNFRFDIQLPKELVYLKILIGIVLLLFSVFSFKFDKSKKSIFIIGAIIIISIISLFLTDKSKWRYVLYIKGQYIYGIIVFFFLINYWKDLKIDYLLKALKYFLWINFILILIGYFFDINIFKTYGERFGYNGLLKSTSVASYFYMFSLMFFLNKKKSKYDYWIIINIIISSLMVGSKTLYLYLIVTLLFIIANKNQTFAKNKKRFLIIFVGAASLASFFYLKLILLLNQVLQKVYQEDGMPSFIFSYRDVLVKNAIEQSNKEFTIVNYLFGGVEYIKKLPQVALVDMFITFGIISSVLFIYFFFINLPKIQNKTIKFMLYIIVGLILLRGNFLYYPSEIFIGMTIFAVTLKTSNSSD